MNEFQYIKNKVMEAINPAKEIGEEEILNVIDGVFVQESDNLSLSASEKIR